MEATSAAQPPQHMRALERANYVRLERAARKREIARGKLRVADLLKDVPEECESMTLAELLQSQTRWGRTRARKLLFHLDLPENKEVGSLTDRQRNRLIDALENPPGRYLGESHR